MTRPTRTCPNCGVQFRPTRTNPRKRYCTNTCWVGSVERFEQLCRRHAARAEAIESAEPAPPTLEEIRERADEIRASWFANKHLHKLGRPTLYMPRTISDRFFDL